MDKEIEIMDKETNLQSKSQKRRVFVDEGLYDFTDEELSYIHQSRSDEEEGEESCSHHVVLQHICEEDFDVNSDTESTSERNFCPNNLPCKKETILGSENYVCSSSLSEYSFGTDESYPEIEVTRWNDFNSNHTSPNSKPYKSKGGFESDNDEIASSCSRDEIDHNSAMQKKIIVPEPELSDPYFPCFEESIEEDRSSIDMSKPKLTLSQKISSLGSFRISVSGGFLGSYVVRKQSKYNITKNVFQNGFFRIWFTKFRSRHFI